MSLCEFSNKAVAFLSDHNEEQGNRGLPNCYSLVSIGYLALQQAHLLASLGDSGWKPQEQCHWEITLQLRVSIQSALVYRV